MTIAFQKTEEWFAFHDSQGNAIERKTEIRFDPLTGESSRLVYDAGLAIAPPDLREAAEMTNGVKCPFCPENLLKITPVFPSEIAEQGRIFQGDAVVFPNLFPYSKHNGVAIFSAQHYVTLEEFTAAMIKDAFLAAQRYIASVAAADPQARYASINWNYLPHSGGSILHPHIHVVVSEQPTNDQALIQEKAAAYRQQYGTEYFTDLYETEKKLGDRWIGECGDVGWMHAYAPKGHNDFQAIFSRAHSLEELREQDWLSFGEGLTRVFAVLAEQGFASFNAAVNIPIRPEARQPVHARLIPRFTLGMLHTSDINFFQALHREPLSYKVPEDIAAKARIHFGAAE